jgi:acyl-CoA thioester hydrolase
MQRLKDEAWRQLVTNYPLRFVVRASWRDVDAYRHVNNVAQAAFMEEGRASLCIAAFSLEAMMSPDGPSQVLVASAVLDYMRQCHYPGEVVVATGFSRIGRTSFNTAGALFQGGRCVALCETVMVHTVADLPHSLDESLCSRLKDQFVTFGTAP